MVIRDKEFSEMKSNFNRTKEELDAILTGYASTIAEIESEVDATKRDLTGRRFLSKLFLI